MSELFRRNGAAIWLGLLLLLYLLVAVAVVLLVRAAPELGAALVDAPALNRALNGVIFGALAVGLVMVVVLVGRAAREEATLNRHGAGFATRAAAGTGTGVDHRRTTDLPRSALRDRIELLRALEERGVGYDATVVADAVAEREEAWPAVARFTAGMLVLLGLLGTFVGLLVTVAGVGEVVESLQAADSDDIEAFLVPLRAGLRAPLAGMGLAFSTSLLGLAGSLVVGAGALALGAAQASWLGKLEQVTSLYLVPAYLGAAASAPAAAAGVEAAAPLSAAGLAELEAGARLLHDTQRGSAEHLARLDRTSHNLAGAVTDFRDRVADLMTLLERLESLLARIADAQAGGRGALNDVSVKLADLAGAAAAVRADVRDGRRELAEQVQEASQGLRDGLSGGLGALKSTVAQGPGVAELRDAIGGLRVELVRDMSARHQESRDVLAELQRIEATLRRLGGEKPAATAARERG